jgi:ribulose-5-phosphate 4-epimerase/fuculose-1-phosphate aldolase
MPPAGAPTDPAAAVVRAARVVAALGLVTAFGHVSARAAGQMWITPAADLADVAAADVVAVPVDAHALPSAAPPESWLHLAVYRRRPDVGGIARGQPPSAFAAGAVAAALPPLHGQAAWLGRRLPVHPGARLLRSPDLAEAAATSLGEEDALVLRGNGAVATGAAPGVAVARLHLVEVACRVWLQARAVGEPHPLDDDDVAAWRAAAPPLLDRLWRHLARGAEAAGPGRPGTRPVPAQEARP